MLSRVSLRRESLGYSACSIGLPRTRREVFERTPSSVFAKPISRPVFRTNACNQRWCSDRSPDTRQKHRNWTGVRCSECPRRQPPRLSRKWERVPRTAARVGGLLGNGEENLSRGMVVNLDEIYAEPFQVGNGLLCFLGVGNAPPIRESGRCVIEPA
jgi:hypothetical protein